MFIHGLIPSHFSECSLGVGFSFFCILFLEGFYKTTGLKPSAYGGIVQPANFSLQAFRLLYNFLEIWVSPIKLSYAQIT
jgi:hypothetical protein